MQRSRPVGVQQWLTYYVYINLIFSWSPPVFPLHPLLRFPLQGHAYLINQQTILDSASLKACKSEQQVGQEV